DTAHCTDLQDLSTNSDLYLLAVSDTAISEVAETLSTILPLTSPIVHTSGATPSSVFAHHFSNYGIFYPLQSFSKEKVVDFKQIPIGVHASNQQLLDQLRTLAQRLSPKVYDIDDQQRAYLHVAAVFANNFTNYMLHIAHQLSEVHEVPFDLLRPLILETANKVQAHPPAQMQTGPAIRADETTMQKHLALLKDNTNWQQLYEALSEAIDRDLRTE
ncbi:MAG: Rossmann-like and DUF2520 domain-containing protein, partial [Bacteroidota bacterium]